MKEIDKKKNTVASLIISPECGEALGPGREKEFRKRVCFEVLWVYGDKEHRILVVVGQQRKRRQWQRVNKRMSRRSSGGKASPRRWRALQEWELCLSPIWRTRRRETSQNWIEGKPKGNEYNRFHQMGPSPETEKGRASSSSLGEDVNLRCAEERILQWIKPESLLNMEPVQLKAGRNTFSHPSTLP